MSEKITMEASDSTELSVNTPKSGDIATIIENNAFGYLVDKIPEHKASLEIIQKAAPQTKRDMSMLGKSASHFADNMCVLTFTTPYQNIKQALSQIRKTQDALRENYFKSERTKVDIAELQEKLLNEDLDKFERARIEIDLVDKQSQLDSGEKFISGAIRKMANFTEQLNNVKKKHNIPDDWTEKDMEEREEEWLIKEAYEQSLTVAASRGGCLNPNAAIIDQANMGYMQMIGINYLSAQEDVIKFFTKQKEKQSLNLELSYKDVTDFLDEMYEKHKGCTQAVAEHRGVKRFSDDLYINDGDMSLFKDIEEKYGNQKSLESEE